MSPVASKQQDYCFDEKWDNADHDSRASPAEFSEGDVTNICGFKIGGFRDLI
jgi:hypothetical protein